MGMDSSITPEAKRRDPATAYIQHVYVLLDGPPEPVTFAGNDDQHLIKKLDVTKRWLLSEEIARIGEIELLFSTRIVS